ncbi:uncharacterized protein LOC111362296 [Spodoptera litura]|uniref:Uncharacterized protein LOC111362296 n=1 Tax=Spodoptera litura TaxID=69820 RepID=A0A9J7ENE2_SPOLT|nr:uncharacterized protein LOC111362296 [Spodoptera litura]
MQLDNQKLYEDMDISAAVPNLENQNDLDEITKDKNYLPPSHLTPDFAEMRNVTPTSLSNENFNCQYVNNSDYLPHANEKFTIPCVEEHNHSNLQLDEDRFTDDEEISAAAAVSYLENISENPSYQSNELSDNQIIEPPPAKKKRVKDSRARLIISKEDHPMGIACSAKCTRKCTANITEEQRQTIWDSYWDMDIQRRRDFISRNVENNKIAIRYSNSTKRNHTYIYRLLNHRVCKTMFLRTLGYTNDQAVLAVLKANFKFSKTPDSAKASSAPDLRRRHKPKHSFTDEYRGIKEIDDFIELFHPTTSHYRLEHAPNRRYLPTGLTLSQMFLFLKHHLETKNKQPCSWSAFHKRIKIKNISTQQPEQDKCPKCEAHDVAHPKPKLPRDEGVTDHLCSECNSDLCIQYPQHLDDFHP